LGLSLAESIAQVHDAEIRVNSTLGKGSNFRVIFLERDAQTSASSSILTPKTGALAGL
jgi:signal transduction histidine kinase